MTSDNSTPDTGHELTDEELEYELANFKPAFDDSTMMELERAATTHAIAQKRRVALAVLTRSADDLSETSKNDPDTYAVMIDAVRQIEEHAESLHHLARTASIRLQIADCRAAQGVAGIP